MHFSIAPVESLEKLRECPDAGLRGIGRRSCVSGALSFLAEVKGASDAGRILLACLVTHDVSKCASNRFLTAEHLRASDSLESVRRICSALRVRIRYWEARPVTLRVLHYLCVRVRCVPDASVDLNMTVRDRYARLKRLTHGNLLSTGHMVWASGDPVFCPVEEPTTLFVWGAYK